MFKFDLYSIYNKIIIKYIFKIDFYIVLLVIKFIKKQHY